MPTNIVRDYISNKRNEKNISPSTEFKEHKAFFSCYDKLNMPITPLQYDCYLFAAYKKT